MMKLVIAGALASDSDEDCVCSMYDHTPSGIRYSKHIKQKRQL